MLMKNLKSFLLLCAFFYITDAYSQLKGLVLENVTNTPVVDATVKVIEKNLTFQTDAKGEFLLNIEPGTYTFYIAQSNHENYAEKVVVLKNDKNGYFHTFMMNRSLQPNTELPSTALSDDDLDNENSNQASSLLSASSDIFLNIAAFNWSAARFNLRGYNFTNSDTYLNGVYMNTLEDDRTVYSDWGGLNDEFRGRDNTLGLEPVDLGFGGLGGTSMYDARALKQRKTTRINYSLSNRGYDHRIMATYNTGILKNNWAFAISGSTRFANLGWQPGTWYEAYSGFIGISKIIKKNSFSLNLIDAPSMRAGSEAATKEVTTLAGNNAFNTAWGYQDGRIRSVNVRKRHVPMAILTHEWSKNMRTTWLNSLALQKGTASRSYLMNYNSPNPNPEYYRNLPSYYLYNGDTANANAITQAITADPEKYLLIDWNAFYNANSLEKDTTINGVTGKWARYAMTEQHEDPMRLAISSALTHVLTDHITLNASLRYTHEDVHKYQKMKDLMGADFMVDIDPFAYESSNNNINTAQNDLNNPNKIVKEGDTFGYNYDYLINNFTGFLQSQFTFKKLDFFLAAEIMSTSMWRDGHYKNGQYPTSSEGKSEVQKFLAPSLKGGLTFKINGRNYVVANLGMLSTAPTLDNILLDPQSNNIFADKLSLEKTQSGEIGYHYRGPYLKLKFMAYHTTISNKMINRIFYHDDLQSLVYYNLEGVSEVHDGIEAAVEAKLGHGFSSMLGAAIGRHHYNNRPTATITQQNDASYKATDLIYWKGFNFASGPQEAYHASIKYNSPKFWFVNLSGNYYRRNWVDINPMRRTMGAVDNVWNGTAFSNIIDQEVLPAFFTLDFFAGYSWKLDKTFKSMKKAQYLGINLSVNNILNNKEIITSGREQLRYDFSNRNPEKFPTKYFYAQGINYMLSLTYRF